MEFRKFSAFNILVAGAMVGALAMAAWAGPAEAGPKDSGKRLKEVERALEKGREKARDLKEKAAKIEQDLALLRRDMVAAASIIQAQERRAAGLIRTLKELEAQEAAKLSSLTARRGQLSGILVALQRVARYPPEALITQPMPPSDTVRSAILLRAAVPQIEQRAVRLRDDLESLAKARREMAEKKAQFTSVTTGLEKERQRLAVLFGQKTVLKHRTLAKRRTEARRLKSLAGEAVTLRDLLNKLNRSFRRSEPKRQEPADSPSAEPESIGKVVGLPAGLTGTPISGQRGKLFLPAVGRIVSRYGQLAKSGLKRKGITFKTAAGAQVVAPYEGRIVYAGKFRGYGELLIIEHGEGYHSLLSGLDRIDSAMGQWVVAGEPVGIMGRPGRKKPLLYVEFRLNGQPINPLPWLAAKR
jgi:septal ring factor EnvC (AmiA/AmiB activator)